MAWIRNAIVDIVVTGLMVLGTIGGLTWAAWAIWIYTPFMLLLRVGAIGAKGHRKKAADPKMKVPETFYHALFVLNVGFPLFQAWSKGDTNWCWVAGAWVAIWALSTWTASRQRKAA